MMITVKMMLTIVMAIMTIWWWQCVRVTVDESTNFPSFELCSFRLSTSKKIFLFPTTVFPSSKLHVGLLDNLQPAFWVPFYPGQPPPDKPACFCLIQYFQTNSNFRFWLSQPGLLELHLSSQMLVDTWQSLSPATTSLNQMMMMATTKKLWDYPFKDVHNLTNLTRKRSWSSTAAHENHIRNLGALSTPPYLKPNSLLVSCLTRMSLLCQISG